MIIFHLQVNNLIRGTQLSSKVTFRIMKEQMQYIQVYQILQKVAMGCLAPLYQ